MVTLRIAAFLTGSLVLLSALSGCSSDAAAQNDLAATPEKLEPPSLQPAGAPPARPSLTPPVPAAKPPSSPPAKAETRSEPREAPRANGSNPIVAQGPTRSDPPRSEGNSERRDRDRDRGSGRRGEREAREGPGGGNPNGYRVNIAPSGRDSRDGPGGGNRMIIGGDNRGGGPERGAGFGGGFAAGGFGGDTARKFKTAPLPDSIPEWFKRNDKDGDGQVAMFEWPKDDLQDFNKYDRNGDGFVTVAEAMHFAPKPPPATASNTPAAPGAASPAASAPGSTTTTTPGAPLASASTDDRTRNFAQEIVRRYDRNSDGKLDQQELQSTTRLRMGWQQFDANRDSILDLEEVTAYLRAQGGGFGGGGFGGPGFGGGFGGGGFGGGGFGGGGDPRGGRGNENPEEGMRRFLGRFDRNNDGKLARDEFPRFFPAERFDEMDTNRDGQIDTQEFTKGMEGMRGRFGGFGGGGGGPGGFGRGRGP